MVIYFQNLVNIILESIEDAEHYVLKKRLISPVQYDTGEKFKKKFEKAKLVDIIFCDSEQEADEDVILNEIGQESNEAPAARSDNVGLLPWVPRR